MRNLTVMDAFAQAFPRRPAVLCTLNADGSTDMVATEWFNWLNTKNQPMISYAMLRTSSLGLGIEREDALYLAFPPMKDVHAYKAGVRTAARGKEKTLPQNVHPVSLPEIPVLVPDGCEAVIQCTLASAYNYPFGKVRIFNCNFEDAFAPDIQPQEQSAQNDAPEADAKPVCLDEGKEE